MSRSTFPTQIDTFLEHTEISASNVASVQRFQELKLKANRTPAEDDELANLVILLKDKVFSAEDFNKLQDSIIAMQTHYRDNVDGYVTGKQTEMQNYVDTKKTEMQSYVDKFTDKGNYNSSTTYMKNNFVTYDGQTYICTVDSTSNVLPTNPLNWRLAAAKGATGAQGLPGLNMVFKNSYDPTVTYNSNDAVEYNGNIYYAKQSSVGETPQSNGTSWTIFMSRASLAVSNSAPGSPTDNMVWVDKNTNLFKYYSTSTSTWIPLNSNDSQKLGGQDPSYYAKATDLSAKYSKPAGGIPKTDLDSSVQTSLGKADSALQSVASASTSVAGIVQLEDTPTISITKAPTSNALKAANDKFLNFNRKLRMGGLI